MADELGNNNTHDNLYVISATWKAADTDKGIPAGFWTRGSYRLAPGKSKVFYSWADNSIYFRISNAESALKPQSSSETFGFWLHPNRSFRVVSQTFDASVTTDQLLYSDRLPDQLVQLEGFVSYTGGSAVVVTPGWVLLDGEPIAPPNDELGDGLGDDGGSPGGDVSPPAWVENVVRNEREEDIYVVFATWKVENPNQGWPEGFRTRGTYRIRPDRGRVFHSWADNESFFHISNADGALKPESSSGTFEFWVHPKRKFRIVSGSFDNGVTKSELLYSNRSKSELAHSDGFLVYETGTGLEVSVTSDWGPVAPVDDGNPGAPVPPETPEPPVNPSTPAGMALIPAGTFQMGSTGADAGADESPVHAVSLDAFYMDTHEVTNAEYAAFLNAVGKHTDAGNTWVYFNNASNLVKIGLSGGRYTPVPAYANHPVTYVSWYGAMAYAVWAGKRLPTEAEWEYAARGGLAGKKYPWGDTIDSTQANYNDNVGSRTAVGSYAANGYGLYDMVGNVWEWCLDGNLGKVSPTSFVRNPLSDRSIRWLLDNYTKIDNGYKCVLRGGAWINAAPFVRVAYRFHYTPTAASDFAGFRCVKPVSP